MRWELVLKLYFGGIHGLMGVMLKTKFIHLFYLNVNKIAAVDEMVLLGWGENGEALKWGGGMLAWEKEHVRECSDILINIVLQP